MQPAIQPFANRRPIVCLVASLLVAQSAIAADKVTYDDHMVPLLRQRCSACHSGTNKKADLDVTNYLSLMQGGASGTVIEPGDADGSYLFSLVTHDSEPYMPQNAEKMPAAEIELLRSWIDGGALENQGSEAVKPKSKTIAAVAVVPGARPETIPLPPRLVLEPHFRTTVAPMARSLATSPWAPLVAVAGQRQVLLYDSSTLELVGVFPFPEGQPNVVRFSRDGALLLAGGGRPAASGKVVVWDITSGERVFEVGDELDAVLAADISADRSQIALGGPQRVVRVYSTATGELQFEITKHTDWVQSVEFSPDGVLLATADRSGGLLLWEAHTGRDYLTLNGHTGAVTSLSWRGDSNLLASGSEDATVRLWEPENGTQVKTWNAQTGVQSLEFARDGRLATCGRDQIARLWDQNGKQLVATPPLGEVAVSVTVCDETNRLVAGNWSGTVQAYQAADAALLGGLATNPPLLAQRLQVAEQQLQETTTAREPLLEALATAAAEAASAQTASLAAQQEADQRQQEEQALTAEANQLAQSLAANLAQQNQTATRLTQIETATPLISEALRLLTETLAHLPDDPAQAEIHKQLTAQLQAIEAESVTTQTKIGEFTATVDAANAKLQETNSQLETTRTAATAVAERQPALKSRAEALAAAAETARQSAQAAETRVVAAQQQVTRWQGEIAFRDRIASLQAQLEAALQATAERQAEVDQANQALAAIQSTVAETKAKFDESAQSVEHLSTEIRAAREAK